MIEYFMANYRIKYSIKHKGGNKYNSYANISSPSTPTESKIIEQLRKQGIMKEGTILESYTIQ